MLCAAAQALPAAPKISQGPLPPPELPLDEPEPPELPEELELPDEPPLPEPPEELEPPDEPPLPELLEEPELLDEPPLPELAEGSGLPDEPPLPELPEEPELLLLMPLELPPELPVDASPEPPGPPDENDPHATAMAPSEAATDTSTAERGLVICDISPVAQVGSIWTGGATCWLRDE